MPNVYFLQGAPASDADMAKKTSIQGALYLSNDVSGNSNSNRLYIGRTNAVGGIKPIVTPTPFKQIIQFNGATKSSFDGTADVTTNIQAVPLVPSTNNALARFDGTGGFIKNSTVTLDDNGNINTPGIITANKIQNTSGNGSIDNNGYVTGTWLRTTANIAYNGAINNTITYPILKGGQIYSRTLEQTKLDLGITTKSHYVIHDLAVKCEHNENRGEQNLLNTSYTEDNPLFFENSQIMIDNGTAYLVESFLEGNINNIKTLTLSFFSNKVSRVFFNRKDNEIDVDLLNYSIHKVKDNLYYSEYQIDNNYLAKILTLYFAVFKQDIDSLKIWNIKLKKGLPEYEYIENYNDFYSIPIPSRICKEFCINSNDIAIYVDGLLIPRGKYVILNNNAAHFDFMLRPNCEIEFVADIEDYYESIQEALGRIGF